MNKRAFDQMVKDIKRNWDKTRGLIVLLDSADENPDKRLRLCLSTVDNFKLLPDTCVVWKGDSLLYNGELDSVHLMAVLTRNKVCLGCITQYMMVDNGSKHIRTCYGTKKDTCVCVLCKGKRKCSTVSCTAH